MTFAFVPQPASASARPGSTVVPASITVDAFLPLGKWLSRSLEDWLDTSLVPADSRADAWLTISEDASLPAGAYRLTVESGVRIAAAGREGVLNAAQTLRQLAGARAFAPAPIGTGNRIELANVAIEDAPVFSFRGVQLDVARHFMPKNELLRFIDLAAAHKLNALHLHLTDDQGWRIDIPAFPRLKEISSWRADTMSLYTEDGRFMNGRPHGGCYSLDDLREAVAYAKERGVTIIPEIDLPGHSVAAIAAYPRLGVDSPDVEVWGGWGVNDCILDPSDYTLDFFRTVLDTVMEVFDAPIIHLGGDEVPYERWHGSESVKLRAKELGLESVELLHGWFLGRLAAHVEANGRRAGVWHEAVSSTLPKTAVVNGWGGLDTVIDSLAAGYDTTISCMTHLYLDFRENDDPREPSGCRPLLSTEKLYSFEPLTPEVLAAAESGGSTITGIQAQVWTEYLDTQDIRDYNTYPRLSAFAELAWSEERDYADLMDRLRTGHLDRLTAAGVGFRPLDGPHPWQERPDIREQRREAAG
jgi:hexosaminidase